MAGDWLTDAARARGGDTAGVDTEALMRLERMVGEELKAKKPLPRLEGELPCSIADELDGECAGAATAVLRLEAGSHVHACPMHAGAIRNAHRVLEAQEVVGNACPWCTS